MRGKRTGRGDCCVCLGLIPAHAGKTFAKPRRIGDTGAHPRACGENALTTITRKAKHGSSPRMRGKRLCLLSLGFRLGLIPAHAGKTVTMIWGSIAIRAHPRACGENGWHSIPIVRMLGSSPRMRGKRKLRQRGGGPPGSSPRMRGKLGERAQGFHSTGLIPAHAGKT